jgi:hypothetical protein
MSREPDEALEVLRGVWSAQGQTGADLGGLDGHGKSCRRMAGVGFEGVPGDDEDLRAAWRDRLRREGKLRPGGESVRDLVLGSAEPVAGGSGGSGGEKSSAWITRRPSAS